MGKGLSKRITAIMAAVCIAVSSCLLCGCVDIHGKKERKYMIEYMDAIPITCHEYKLVVKYSSSTEDNTNTVIVDGKEKEVDVVRNKENDYTLIIDVLTVNITKEILAEKCAEYVTISEMWFRHRDKMDEYYDNMPSYRIEVFDNTIFVVTRFRQGGGAWRFSYDGSMPACLFKYDIENDAVLYAGYCMNDTMSGPTHIEKVENN